MKPLAQNTLIQNRYLIVHLIGKGGMGEVYLAVDQRLGSAVALKRTYFAGDEMLGNAFEREARTLARMRHPVLPKVSDHFGEGEEQYLVMEHISGDDLAKRLELAQKPFPVSWVLFWADQLLDALSYLHTHEPPIIHRDIKPQNLKLTDENHIILLDFGLSKTSTGMTNVSQSGSTGSVVGYTPHYAPMEQIRGIGTSAKSDLYSLSATLYQLMTNKIPVDALSRADSMLNELPDPITPPHKLNPEVPEAVSEVLLKGMEVSQDKRYADAREMQKVLRKAFNEMQQATTAKTVAFNAFDKRADAIDQPAASLAADAPVPAAATSVNPFEQNAEPVNQTVASPVNENDAPVDFDATIAFDPAPVPAAQSDEIKQADVRTEVFLAGSNSLPIPEKQSYESAAPRREDPAPAPSDNYSSGSSNTPENTSAGFSPDATIPYISADHGGASESVSEVSNETGYYSGAASGDAFSSPSPSPYAETPASEAYVSQPSVVNEKKSSKTAIAVVGGLAAIFLLAVIVAGGTWAYFNYGPGMTEDDPTPTPTPEPTLEITPTPEPTLETIVNSNSSTDPYPSNSDSNSASNSDVLTVEPTPENSPEADATPGTRPTPQIAPRETPVRPTGTPREKPPIKPKKTPVVSPTVLQ